MEFEIPNHILTNIKQEVANDVAPILEEDPDTAEYLADIMQEYRILEFKFLSLIDSNFYPEKVLYAASGFDIIPKLAFGNQKVVYTSLESYRGGDQDYFKQTKGGMNVVADNINPPFKNSTFETLLIFGLSDGDKRQQIEKLTRVVAKNGILILASNVIDPTVSDETLQFLEKDFQRILVPEEFHNKGISETTFYLFKKK